MGARLSVAVLLAVGLVVTATDRLGATANLASLPFGVVDDACKYECRECTYRGETGHDIVVGQVNGNSSSHLENCGPGNCDSHSCNGEFPEGEALWFILREADGLELFDLLSKHQGKVAFNESRGSVQLLCSEGQVIANLPLSASQIRHVAELRKAHSRASGE